MTFKNFKDRINKKISESGAAPAAVFVNDEEKGLFRAVFADGMQITARPHGTSWSVHLANMPKRAAFTLPDAAF